MNRFSRIILVSAVSLASAFTTVAQKQRLVMPELRMSVSSIFQQIGRQTNLGVAYRTDQIDPQRIVTLPSLELSLAQTLQAVTADSDYTGVIDGAVIVFVDKTPAPGTMLASDGFTPTPLSQFRESLGGLRPRKEVVENELAAQMPPQTEDTVVEIEMPMGSHLVPAQDYAVNLDKLPAFALKTNLLYGAATLTPNLSMEFGLGVRTSLEIGGSYNPWKLNGSLESNRKLVHMVIKPEFRYWLCERFDGHFFGVHALYSRYNIGTYDVPGLFEKEYRYDGHAFGAGITYGHNLSLHKRWGVEFAVGVGALWLDYDRYDCAACDREPKPDTEFYFGPTNAAISLVYLIK